MSGERAVVIRGKVDGGIKCRQPGRQAVQYVDGREEMVATTSAEAMGGPSRVAESRPGWYTGGMEAVEPWAWCEACYTVTMATMRRRQDHDRLITPSARFARVMLRLRHIRF